jgi:hypothetical protein
MYSSEATFSRALLTALKAKAKRALIQRIETGETGRGVPDLYLRSIDREYWLELKNVKRSSVYNGCWQIPWRPGQQAWALQYRKCSGLCVFTIVAVGDGFLLIPMLNRLKDNIVYPEQCMQMTQLSDVVNCIIGGLEKYVY